MPSAQPNLAPDDFLRSAEEFVHLARLALEGRHADVAALARRLTRRYRESFPELASQLITLAKGVRRPGRLGESPLREAAAWSPSFDSRTERRDKAEFAPVDLDSRLDLVRVEWEPEVPVEPIWTSSVRKALRQIVAERSATHALAKAGLTPTRTALFAGPPGVGKTLAARWIAQQLGRPLIVLDLATVMSSFLGRTGTNLRHVMDYAKSVEGVLLLDEIDALAKRRDDQHEVGELKRLVTALLQEIDAWPSTGLLIAATNHPDLLDPAAWRRFEIQLRFPFPSERHVQRAVRTFLGNTPDSLNTPTEMVEALSVLLRGQSYSDIERELTHLRRSAVLNDSHVAVEVLAYIKSHIATRSRSDRSHVAAALVTIGLSQREVSTLTGVSRDTIRKAQRGIRIGAPEQLDD